MTREVSGCPGLEPEAHSPLVGVRVGPDSSVGASIERVDRRHLLRAELEVEDGDVLVHALGPGGLGIAIWPCCMCQRRMIRAADLP